MSTELLPHFIRDNHDVHESRHSLAILRQDFPEEDGDDSTSLGGQ
jgi:hypothetical protein